MATQTDLTKLSHILAHQLHLYYEKQEDGTAVLRHIRANSHVLEVPSDGITIDTLPPDIVGPEQLQTGSVGTRQIENESVELEDLSEELQAAIDAEHHVADENDVRQIVTDYDTDDD